MEKIKIVFLGTSSAVPTVTRSHSSIYLKYKDENILIDCGEGTQRQIRRARINPCKITRLLITHLHGDHVFGIPGLFQTLNLNGYNKTLLIYGPIGTKQFINNIFKTFGMDKNVKIKVYVNEVTSKVFETDNFSVSALPLFHGTPTLGYSFQEKDMIRIDKRKLAKINIQHSDKPKLQQLSRKKDIKVNGKIIRYKDLTYVEKGRKISFILDTKECPNIRKLAKGSDIAVIESTFFDSEDIGKDHYHLTADQAVMIARQSNVKKLVLTHISQRYEFKEKMFLDKLKKRFSATIIAEDLMEFEI